jgi:hypothetical protein
VRLSRPIAASHLTRRLYVKALDQLDCCAFATAGRSDKGDFLPGGGGEGKSPQDLLLRLGRKRKVHMHELDTANDGDSQLGRAA